MKTFKTQSVCSIFAITVCLSLVANGQGPNLQDVPYKFDSAKVQAAKDSFHFLRSFVDLFYLSFKANQQNLPTITNLSQTQGWCVGDAHAENFGVLLQENKTPLFTMNDMDDSGPCPVVLDLYRLMVSSRLYDSNTKLDKLVEAYVEGLKGNGHDMPQSIQDMMAKSIQKGILPSDKKVQNNKFIRDSQMNEVSPDEKTQIIQALKSYNGILSPRVQLLDVVETSKVGGGSGGLTRYEVLLNNGGTPLHLEFKEEVIPSIYPVSSSIPPTAQRIASTIAYAQGSDASKLYSVLQINGKNFLARPRFAGNIGVSLDKQSNGENKDIIRFEAYTLGLIHSHSIKDADGWSHLINSVSNKDLENEVGLMTDYFDQKYKQVKGQ